MKPIYEIRDYLLRNAVNEKGDLDISGLDFSEFEGDVVLGGMKVKGSLYQGHHKVKGNLFQGYQIVEGSYFCTNIEVGGGTYADEPTKLFKKVTLKELEEMGYRLKDE